MSTELVKVQAELGPEVKQLPAGVAYLRDRFEIKNAEDLALAVDLATDAKARFDYYESKRTSITGPINKGLKEINDFFRPALQSYNDTIQILKAKMGAYNLAVENQRKAMAAASCAEYQAGGTPTAIIPEPPKVDGMTMKIGWDFRITDAKLVPREYCSPDRDLILVHRSAEMQGSTPPRPIPGIEFFQVTETRFTGKRK